MRKIETLIKANFDKHPNFEEYYKIIDVIKESENSSPDICIESCKALIEGVSKTIYCNIDPSKSITELDKYTSVEKLFKESMSKLAEKCNDDFEGDFVRQYSSMIHVIGEIRNKRGDISHGRVAPKLVYSSIKFASTVVKMTESILEYILEHYFQLDLNPIIKLDFDADEMTDYNAWLDESVEFPIAKARYSKVLYDNDYDEYESSYNDYLKSIEKEDSVEPPTKNVPPLAPFASEPFEAYNVVNPVTVEPKQKKEAIQLVNNFDPTGYWTKKRIERLFTFAESEQVIDEKLYPIIDEYIFSGKRPLRDSVVECLKEKPSLRERAKTVDVLTDKIMAFTNELNALTE